METIAHAIEDIFRRQSHAFNINLSFSFILQHRETGEFRYHYASNNNQILNSPRLIRNQQDLENLLDHLAAKDFPSFKTFGVSEQKGFFPYDYFTSAEQLDETTLPPYESFYSTIKGCSVLEEEHTAFQKLIDQGKSEQEALQILRLTSKPKTGHENYQWLHKYGLKISGPLLQIFLNGITIWM